MIHALIFWPLLTLAVAYVSAYLLLQWRTWRRDAEPLALKGQGLQRRDEDRRLAELAPTSDEYWNVKR